jgi:hypothetical protein
MSPPTSSLPDNVLAALQRGNIVEAIKLLRESTGLGLKEAKDLIDQHVRGEPTSPATGPSPGLLPPAVVAALRRGDKIEAIRLLRQATGVGLKEAKDTVESFQSENPGQLGQRSPGQVPKSSVSIWLIAALAALAILAYVFFRDTHR